MHGLLPGGLAALCELFPGFDRDLAAAGAVPIRIPADIHEELPGFDPFPRRDLGPRGYCMSRPLLERVLRRRAHAAHNVVIRDSCRVLELIVSADGRGIVGARCASALGMRETLQADLVVDASARGTLTLAALQAMGLGRPPETKVGVDIGYSTAIFEMPEQRPDWRAVLTFADAPRDSRCGYLIPVEGKRWMACITQQRCQRPPADLAEFLDAAQRLRTPTIHAAIRDAVPVAAPQRFSFPESSWRHYEALARFPQGLIPIGDAVCRFNPVYGQGMSVAATEASILASLLRRRADERAGLTGLEQEFLAEIRPWIAGAWSMSALPDLAFPQTRGERPADLEHALGATSALYRIAARDPEIHALVVEVRYLLRPASALQEPTLTSRVLAEMAAASAGTASEPRARAA